MSFHHKDNIEVSSNNEVSSQHKKLNIIIHIEEMLLKVGSDIRFAVCKVEKVKGVKCGTKYKVGTSTNFLRDLIPVLGPFEEATRYLGSSNYATYSIMNSLISEIVKRLKPATLTNKINIEKIDDIFVAIEEDTQKKDLDNSMQTLNALEGVKETLYRAILFYLKRDNASYLPSILDPHIKKIEFASNKINEIQVLLKNKYQEIKSNLTVNSTTVSTTTALSQNLSNTFSPNSILTPFYKPTLFSIFNNLPTVNSQSELDEYLTISQIPFDSDLFSL
ncbi:9796_t:CDS:2 [Racocetra fulgida]|uniref:9796_t:CDS:1 n=1 Tax=Racocetra fulgida TaxID=60492 RepID=A0A9N9AXN6_9GLOM|nr:9796_t:CDS:2 [Racocetra fulgida]